MSNCNYCKYRGQFYDDPDPGFFCKHGDSLEFIFADEIPEDCEDFEEEQDEGGPHD